MDSNENIKSLIALFVDLAKREGSIINITKLVKLLYLAEIYYYKQNQKRLTNLPWKYYKKGPWCSQIDSNIEHSDNLYIPENENFRRIKLKDKSKTLSMVRSLDIKSHNAVMYVYKKYAHFELNLLLSYVYNHTSPMKNAKIDKYLDFSVINSTFNSENDFGQESQPLTDDEKQLLEKKLAERKKNEVPRKTYFGPGIYEAIEAMNKEDDLGLHD